MIVKLSYYKYENNILIKVSWWKYKIITSSELYRKPLELYRIFQVRVYKFLCNIHAVITYTYFAWIVYVYTRTKISSKNCA